MWRAVALLASLHAVLPVTFGELTTDQHSVVTCVGSIAMSHFSPGQLLVVSTPKLQAKRPHVTVNAHGDDFEMVNTLLENMNTKQRWPILTFQQNASVCDSETSEKHYSYILFLWEQDEDSDILKTLHVQLDSLEECAFSFNRRGKFVVVVADKSTHSQDLAKDIIKTMWEREKIVNLLVMVCSDSRAAHHDDQTFVFDLYTWFPYEPSQCGQVEKIVLLDQCVSGGLLHNITYFPSKVPQDLIGCPIKASVSHMSPYVILTQTNTDEEGTSNITYRYRGIEIEYLLILTAKMNSSLVYLPPKNDYFIYRLVNQIQDVKEGIADVALGYCPLIPFITTYGEPTVPYIYSSIKWYVPCAKPAGRQIFRLFTPSVWLAVGLAFILTCAIFWGSSNGVSGSTAMESKNFRTLSSCFQNAWAISLGVAVPQRPISSRLRMFFLLSVWYSFFMNIVFQVSFTSFIVEPGYEKQIETFKELIESGARFAQDPMTKLMAQLSSYHDHEKLKGPVEDCSDQADCLKRYLTDDGITTIAPQFQAQYMASMVGTTEKRRRLLCTTNRNIATGGLTMILTRGHPLLDRFNKIIQHSFEAGLVKKYWTELTLNASLHKAASSADGSTSSRMYIAFTTSHLRVSFCVLCSGLLLSFVVFLGELLAT
jgi:hypothetical protein